MLGERFMREHYNEEQVIVAQEEPGDRFYVIESGQVEVVVKGAHEPARLSLLGPGDFFGEMALMSEQPRSASVIATRPTTVFSLARTDFQTLMEGNASIRIAVEDIVSARRSALNLQGKLIIDS